MGTELSVSDNIMESFGKSLKFQVQIVFSSVFCDIRHTFHISDLLRLIKDFLHIHVYINWRLKSTSYFKVLEE